MEPIQIIIRPYDQNIDDPFIYSTWTKNAYYSPREPISVSKKQWFENKSKDIKFSLENHSVCIACHKNNRSIIAGYMVVNNGKLEWLYIKKDYRYDGVEELLTKQLKETDEDTSVMEDGKNREIEEIRKQQSTQAS